MRWTVTVLFSKAFIFLGNAQKKDSDICIADEIGIGLAIIEGVHGYRSYGSIYDAWCNRQDKSEASSWASDGWSDEVQMEVRRQGDYYGPIRVQIRNDVYNQCYSVTGQTCDGKMGYTPPEDEHWHEVIQFCCKPEIIDGALFEPLDDAFASSDDAPFILK